jgi:hypothetical protein
MDLLSRFRPWLPGFLVKEPLFSGFPDIFMYTYEAPTYRGQPGKIGQNFGIWRARALARSICP